MKTLLASLLIAATAAAPAVAGPDFVAGTHRTKPLAASEATTPILPSDDVVFEHNKFQLIDSARAQIETVAGWLQRHPRERIILEGHSDSIGTAAYNEDLAARRAEMVRMQLIGHGIPSDRIVVVIYGEARARRSPSPIDRRVVMHATTHAPESLAQRMLYRRGAVHVMWTQNNVLFTETRGRPSPEARRAIATR